MRNLFRINPFLHYLFASSTYFLMDFAVRPPDFLSVLFSLPSESHLPIQAFLLVVFLTSTIILSFSVSGLFKSEVWYPIERRSAISIKEYLTTNAIILLLISGVFYLFFLCSTIIIKDYGGSIAGIVLVFLPVCILVLGRVAARLFGIRLSNDRVSLVNIVVFCFLSFAGIFLYKGSDPGSNYIYILFFALIAFVGRGVFSAFLLIVQTFNSSADDGEGNSIFFPNLNQSVLVIFMFMTFMCLVLSSVSRELSEISVYQISIAIAIGVFSTGLAEVFKNRSISIDGVPSDVIEAFSFVKGLLAGFAIWGLSNARSFKNLDFWHIDLSLGDFLKVSGLILLTVAACLWTKWRSGE